LLILAAGWGPRDKVAVRAAQKKTTLQISKATKTPFEVGFGGVI